jgi:sugar phosphate isomerase/epimerase
MKLGIFANAYADLSLKEALKKIHHLGAEYVELASGEEMGNPHIDPKELLTHTEKLREFKSLLDAFNLKVSAISCHGNPVSPRELVKNRSIDSMNDAVLLAEKLGIDRIVAFSGCPGDCEEAEYASWVVMGEPAEYRDSLEWQWETKLIPYWSDFVAFARDHGVNRIALELHPGFSCYNPKSLKKLRDRVGDEIGANLDLSHLLWQGMDPIMVIRELGETIYHMHAKDVSFDQEDSAINGMLTTVDYPEPLSRPFNFRIPGFGHGLQFWRNVFAELRKQGYDDVASVELECELFDVTYGMIRATDFLRQAMLFDSMNVHDKWLDTVIEPTEEQRLFYGI